MNNQPPSRSINPARWLIFTIYLGIATLLLAATAQAQIAVQDGSPLTNASGPWTTNARATSPFLIIPNQPQKFYRVIAP